MQKTCELYQTRGRHCDGDRFARDVLEGLSRTPKTIPSVYFYDDAGSRLFQQITEQDEYYLTRAEQEILECHGPRIAELVSERSLRLIELGAGDGRKTEVLIDAFLGSGRSMEYVPIDICEQSIREVTETFARRRTDTALHVHGVAAEYFDGLGAVCRRTGPRNMVLFLGSSIGNLSRMEARRFFRNLRENLADDDYVLIGFDLMKDAWTLHRAYDDAAGVTRRFNLNLLDRINSELGGEFDSRRFRHRAVFNAAQRRMESWLISLEDQQVPIAALDRVFTFAADEGVHVESSHKYDVAEIAGFAAESGFAVEQDFFDTRRYFVDSLWRAVAA